MATRSQWDGPGTLTPYMTLLDTPAAVVPAVPASVAGPATTPAAAPVAAVMAVLLGQITCPSGSRSA